MTEKAPHIYEFENFRLDPRRKSLWHAGELVPLTPKAFDTLLVLVRNAGEVVGKGELLDEVWADTFVEESTLSQNIRTLRKALASFGTGTKFIDTVPRRGYRFVARVRKLNGSEAFANGNGGAVPLDVLEHLPAARTNRTISERPGAAQRKSIPWTAAAVFAVLLAVAGSIAWYLGRPSSQFDTSFRAFVAESLLSEADIRSAAVSPDGNLLYLIERRGGSERMMVRHLKEADPIEVVAPTTGRIIGAAFSPDSQYVFYSVYREGPATARIGELFRVSTLGGPAQAIVSDIDSPPAVSKAGKLSFVRRRPAEGITDLVLADLDGRNEAVVSSRKLEEGYLNASIAPDGRSVVAAARSKRDLKRPMELVLVDVANGAQRSLTDQPWLWIGQSAWLPDGSGVAVVAYGIMSPNLTDEIWLVSVPNGNTRLLEGGVNGAFGVSISEDGNSLVAVKSDKITSFVVSPVDDLARETVLVTKAGDQSLLPLGAEWAADGRIIYSTTDNGNADLWSVRIDGGDRKRLTADKFADFYPQMSPDGRAVYFLSNRSGQTSVWRSDPSGGSAEKLTDGGDAFSVNVTNDGRSIYYTARADSIFAQHLWRADADGKNPVRITSKTTIHPKISPDGKTIACFYPAPETNRLVLSILNAENGEVVRQFPERGNDFLLEWMANGRELILLSREGPGSSLWRFSVDTGEATPLREFPNENVFRLALSPNGDRLFYEKGVSVNNVLLLRPEIVSIRR